MVAGRSSVAGSSSTRQEVVLKPKWYNDVWSPEKITGGIYEPMLGSSAITDDPFANSAEDLASLLNSLSNGDSVGASIDADGNSVVSVDGYSFKLEKTKEGSVESAIDALVMVYGALKQNGLSTDAFIRDYTFRPIATLRQILGSSSVTFDLEGNVVGDAKGSEGFHGRAFGDYNTDVTYAPPTEPDGTFTPKAGANALALLLPVETAEPVVGSVKNYKRRLVNRGAVLKDGEESVPAYLDPRGRAFQRVNAYAAELRDSRGLAAL
jgi:hypothetical protein